MDLGLRSDDRVLVLGSSGWFGREFRAMFDAWSPPSVALWVAGPSDPTAPQEEDLQEFHPTVVVNFAFLTRERLESDGEKVFVHTNTRLTDRFQHHASRPGVRLAVTISSGAAVSDPDHPYGRLKAAEEQRSLELIDSKRSVVVIRAFSVSGGYVRRPRDYAFSDFIMQAPSGAIHVAAPHLVFRRYCSVRDALTVALRSGTAGRSGVFETGGDRVEMGELASTVSQVVNPKARVLRSEVNASEASEYCSDDRSWREWCADVDVQPSDLNSQVTQAATVLLGR